MSFLSVRKRSGKTRAEVAKHFGVAWETVYTWDRGTNYPRVPIIIEMTEYYGCAFEELLLEGEPDAED